MGAGGVPFLPLTAMEATSAGCRFSSSLGIRPPDGSDMALRLA